MIPDWIGPAALIVVALISAVSLVIVRRVRGPVAIQDLWAENRLLRADMASLDRKVNALIASQETQLYVNRIMGDGFDALSGYVERTTTAGTKPAYTAGEHEAIWRARALRVDETMWNTQSKESKENR